MVDVSEISGPSKTQTAARPSFYDEKGDIIYGAAELEKMENKPFSVDNAAKGHIGYPAVATPPPTVRIGKKRPTIVISSNGVRRPTSDAFIIVLMLIVGRQRCQ